MGARLAAKVALINTAAGQGIGRASALRFAAEGATVWATDINPAALETLQAECPSAKTGALKTRVLDVRDTAAVSALVAEIGTLDVLFNCAGYVHQGDIFACSEQDWDSSFRSQRQVDVPHLPRGSPLAAIAAGRGSIVNMSSAASSLKSAAPNRFVYGTTKAAVIGLTKAIAVDVVAKGIRCNAIRLGTIDTLLSADRASQRRATWLPPAPHFSRARRWAGWERRKRLPISRSISLQTNPRSPMRNGQAFLIDGGWTI